MSVHFFGRPMSLAAGLRCAVAALTLLGAPLLVLASAGGAGGAAAAASPRPVILSVAVSTPHGVPLPASGARVVVSVRVRNAISCTFLRQHSASSSLYPLKTVGCASGHARVTVPPIANTYKRPVHLTYAVRVRGAGTHWTQRSVSVAQAAAVGQPPPPTTAAGGASTAVCSPSPCTAGSLVRQTISAYDSDGSGKKLVTRNYYIYRPNGLTNSSSNKAPLLFVFSGDPGQENVQNAMWSPVANANRFVIVYFPDRQNSLYENKAATPQPWLDGSFVPNLFVCGNSGTAECDDVPAENAILNTVIASQNIDTGKIYAEGESKGGQAVDNMACDPAISSRVSAYANISGTSLSNTANNTSPHCPALSTNKNFAYQVVAGTNDFATPYNGLVSAKGNWTFGMSELPTAYFNPSLGCHIKTTSAPLGRTGKWRIDTWTGCAFANRATSLVTVTGAGHAWSSMQNYDGYDGLAEVWNFFVAYGGK